MFAMFMDKNKSKQDISSLVAKYQRLADTGKLKDYNEAQTVNEFILPMFQFLGWDIHNIHADEVTPEERISKGRVDWAFRIDSIPKFFLEAKALKVDLDVGKWAEQAINYSWNKGCTWAILTDFEAIKVFNADVSTKNLKESLFFEIPVDEYLSQFDQLWLLSKEAFKEGFLDKEAEKWGKKIKRTPVGDMLFQDLTEWRNLLTKHVHAQNKLDHEELDEGVQRIIDRLVFIRVTEDRGIEPNILLSALRTRSEGRSLAKILAQIFRNFDEGYNSKLFTPHASENWHIDNESLEMVINGLYETKDGYRYDFSAISSDVLGGIYEQYLGHILRQAKKRASVKKEHKKRKEHGIYYTPTFIVKYIVKNTLGRMLEEMLLNKAMNIRILDPACGSGSFLVEALDVMDSYLETQRKQKTKVAQMEFDFFRKVEILSRNIYGVDLDPQAVEICQLNLLLRTLKRRAILPNLTENITCGNSLISGEPLELIKYFDNPDEKRCLNWDKAFPDVMKNGGFDVIIGNPPYVRIQTLPKDEVIYFSEQYQSAMSNYDIYVLFVERGLQLLKEGGILGFILPKKFFTASYGEGLRRVISKYNALAEIVDFGHEQVFEGATTYTCLLFLRKGRNKTFRYGTVKTFEKVKSTKNLDKDSIEWVTVESKMASGKTWFFAGGTEASVIEKLENLPKLETIATNIFVGLQTSADSVYILDYIRASDKNLCLYSKALKQEIVLESTLLKPIISGVDVKRYNHPLTRQYILFPYQIVNGKAELIKESDMKQLAPKTYEHLKDNEKVLRRREGGKFDDAEWYRFGRTQNISIQEQVKICVPRLVSRIQAIFDEKGEFYLDNVDVGGLVLKEGTRENYLYILALLNSSLLTYYLTRISTPFRGGFYSCNKQYLSQLPLKLLNLSNPVEKSKHDELVILADKMRNLNKELQKTSENTDKWYSLKKEVEQTDKLIDEIVYELYGLTEKEIAIIENKQIES